MFWRDDIDPNSADASGGSAVLIKRGEFVDDARGGRIVPYKIYHPEDFGSGKLPVIFWSHGFGGSRDGAAFLSRFIASHGYVMVHATHYGTDSSLWEGKGDHPWDILKKISVNRETTLNRFMDVSFTLDELAGWADENLEAGQQLDFDRLGISGHSFGALTSQVMAGQLFPDEREMLGSYRDDRFKAGILYSPVPIRHLVQEEGLEARIYGPIAIPLFHMTGTEDDSPLKGFEYQRRLVVYEHTGHDEKYLLVKKDGDHMVYNGTRGKLEANPLRKRHEEIIKIGSLAFWDAQIKGDKKAKEWFAGVGFASYVGEDGAFSSVPDPGTHTFS